MLAEPLKDTFRHRQTTANAVRFTTSELSTAESRILNASARSLEIEKRLYQGIKGTILDNSARISLAARAIAEVDVIASNALVARDQNWVRPVMDMSHRFKITGGRHPVVEAALTREGTAFVPNDSDLGGKNTAALTLLTGPNMAGKSTYLRQNALIAILAQSGAYVPGGAAHIGLVSQVFSRVGASDDLARGRSTFMVEMVETAAILNQADDRALVILDEIGRGTATFDGLSIAWATLEHLHDINKCRGLFATHYHEMTRLSERLDRVSNATMAVKEWDGDIVFLHEVKNGAADRSYGVQVAKLAGMPKPVLDRATAVLEALEKGEDSSRQKAIIDELPLFAMTPAQPEKLPKTSELETKLAGINPDQMTPMDALQALYDLKQTL